MEDSQIALWFTPPFHRQRWQAFCATALLGALFAGVVHAHPLDLSGRSRNGLAGPYAWDIQLANGLTAQWKTAEGTAGLVQAGESEWFRAGMPLGSRRVEMEVASYGLLVTVERTADEARAAAAAESDVPGLEAAQEKLNLMLDRVSAECHNLPEQQQAVCSMKFNAPVEALTQKIYALESAAKAKADRISDVCTVLKLNVRDGVVSGQADYCAGEPDVAVKGTVRSIRAE